MEDGDSQRIETRLDQDSPELSTELMESIALEAVAAAPISQTTHDDARSEPLAIAAGEGRPHFVMESIDGQPIDQYCDSRRLDVPARLRLFGRVCEAVHFAHQHAMIHRDLKPGNILVAADGVPTIVDFGIAKRIDPETRGELVLTPEYASPEQINGEPVTTASELYALGLVLYQLLAGRWPYRVKSPRTTADVLQAICEQAPERPSVAVFRIDEPETQQVATARGCAPDRLKRILAGDLDAIVLMALSKEPEGRYGSADQFADDLDRYRKGLPVRARRNSIFYRAGKFARRYAAAIAAGLLLVLALIGGIVATTRGLRQALRDRDRVEDAFRKSRQAFNPLFTLASEDRLLNQAGLHPLRQALLLDLKRFYEDFLNQAGDDPTLGPEVAEAHAHLGKIGSLTGSAIEATGQYQQAIALWEALVEAQPGDRKYQAELAQTLNDIGETRLSQDGRLDEAWAAFSRAQGLIESLVGADPESVPLRHKLASILMNIAGVQRRRSEFEQAAQSLEKVVEIESQLAAEGPQSLDPRIALAGAYSASGRLFLDQPDLVEAMKSYQQAIDILDLLTQQHPELADQSSWLAADLGHLSDLQQKIGLSGAAVESLRRSLEIYERLTQWYPSVVAYQEGLGTTYNLLSVLRRHQGETGEALALARKAQSLFERLVAEYPKQTNFPRDLAKSHNNIGRLLKRAGEPAEALRSFQRAIDVLDGLPDLGPKDSYDLACNVALCISLIGSKGTGIAANDSSKSDQFRRRIYSDRAIAALRHASHGGFLDTDLLQSNTDFDSIRHRPDFQALVKEVEEKPATAGK